MADSVSVKVHGLAQAKVDIKKYQVIKKEAVKIITKETAMKIEASAKRKSPVQSGRLRASITTDLGEIAKLMARVGTNVEYGIYQEYGTRKMRAHPFLRPAAFENENSYNQKLKEALKK